jgi:hypothetical protein
MSRTHVGGEPVCRPWYMGNKIPFETVPREVLQKKIVPTLIPPGRARKYEAEMRRKSGANIPSVLLSAIFLCNSLTFVRKRLYSYLSDNTKLLLTSFFSPFLSTTY